VNSSDELRQAIVNAAAFNTKHISPYEPYMKNLIIDIDMLVEQMTALISQEVMNHASTSRGYQLGYEAGKQEALDALTKGGDQGPGTHYSVNGRATT
jgi:hypothetical protein